MFHCNIARHSLSQLVYYTFDLMVSCHGCTYVTHLPNPRKNATVNRCRVTVNPGKCQSKNLFTPASHSFSSKAAGSPVAGLVHLGVFLHIQHHPADICSVLVYQLISKGTVDGQHLSNQVGESNRIVKSLTLGLVPE